MAASCTKYFPSFLNLGRDARKPVFGVSDKAKLKPFSLATETSLSVEILHEENYIIGK